VNIYIAHYHLYSVFNVSKSKYLMYQNQNVSVINLILAFNYSLFTFLVWFYFIFSISMIIINTRSELF